MAKKPTQTKAKQEAPAFTQFESELLMMGHLVKYNLYLLSKAIVFAAISQKEKDPVVAATKANQVIDELDLDTKRKKEQAQ